MCLTEGGYKLSDRNETEGLLQVMRKLCRQAVDKEEQAEYIKVFRREFGKALENSYIWD